MDKILFKNTFIAIVERDGYYFHHNVRTQGKIVAIVPHREIDRETEYLARVEVCPAHKSIADRYCITGGLNVDEIPVEAARRELLEEAGYAVEVQDLIYLGQVRPSKQSDTVAHLFGVDVTTKKQHTIKGDGTYWEEYATVEWVSFEDGLKIVDPLFVTIMARLRG